jgi:hypothetical protein
MKKPYVQTSPASNSERRLLENLSQELTQLFGTELYVIPNAYNNVDKLFREDRKPVFNKAFKVPVIFMDAVEGYSGDAIYSKFGFTNAQEFSFIISAKEWREIAALNNMTGDSANRPMEGDLVYVPMQDEVPMFGATDFFRIRYVDKFAGSGWFPLGIHHTMVITCEKWTYSSEHLATGVTAVDSQEAPFSLDVAVNPDMSVPEPWQQNTTVQTISDDFVSFDENSPFGQI